MQRVGRVKAFKSTPSGHIKKISIIMKKKKRPTGQHALRTEMP